MRLLTSTLELNQKAMGPALSKVVLTQQGDSTSYTYGLDTTNLILSFSHIEEEWSQILQILVDNRDGNLTALTLEGYSAVVSNGFNDATQGDEYSACAPLEVIGQKGDSLQGDAVTSFSLAGVFNMMGEDHASVTYTPKDTNTDTLKTILTAIAEATLVGFTHCKAYTITFDSEDSLIDSFVPADYFTVTFNESRLSAFKKALGLSKCKARIEDDGEIHIYVPTISGDTWVASTAYVLNDYVQPTTPNNNFTYKCTTAGTSGGSQPAWPTTAGGTVADGGAVWTAVAFDYEYNDAMAAANHNFFDKSVRTRLVIPTKEVVSSHPDHASPYSGSATDTASETALNRSIPNHRYLRVTSDAQCTAIATAVLQHRQIGAEKGHGLAPMNVGQEVMDYVKITDSRLSDIRIGNVGYLHRWYTQWPKQPTRFGMEFRFGTLEAGGLAGTLIPRDVITRRVYEESPRLSAAIDEIFRLRAEVNALTYNQDLITDILTKGGKVPKWHVEKLMIIPVHLPNAPIVTTQAVSDIDTTTATGNGTITSLGLPFPTAYGVCWSTSRNPTTAESKTDEGAATAEGAFTTSMTGLTTGTLYYVKAYATNTEATVYGGEVSFTTL